MTNQKFLRRWQPVCPVVPTRLWATTAAVAVAGLNAVFYAEIWSSSVVSDWAWLALLGLLLLAGAQTVPVLWRWPPPPLAPPRGQWLWRVGMGALAVGLGIGLLVGAAGAGVLLMFICSGGFAGNR